MREKIVRRKLADGTVKEYRYQAGGIKPRTVGALIADYKASHDFRKLKPSSQQTYQFTLDKFTRFHNVALSDLKRRNILGHRDGYADRPATANLVLGVWQALMRFAIDREYIEHSPAQGIRLLKGGEYEPWRDEHVAFALETFPEDKRRAVILALFTGQRASDVQVMRWADYDGAGIRVVQQKTGAKLWVPAHTDLRACLDAWKEEPRTALTILTNRYGKPWKPKALSHAMSGEIGKHVELSGLVFHGLRKTATVRLAEAGCTAHEIAAVTGHASLGMIQHYSKGAEQERQAIAAIAKLENAGKTAKNKGDK